jgi:hypothetical protein
VLQFGKPHTRFSENTLGEREDEEAVCVDE